MKDPSVDTLPSYNESLLPSPPSRAPLSASLSRSRQHLISTLLTTHIHPHMHTSALSGLSKTILVLVPSNVSSLHPAPFIPTDPDSYCNPFDKPGDGESFLGEKIIGFPSAENLFLIRLHGAENTLEFWRQPAVIRDLETQLRAELWAGGHRLADDGEETNRNGTGMVGSNSASASVEWRFVEEAAVGEGELRVGVQIGDVSLRIENAMGLYETRAGKAIVVKVELGG